jgi:peptidoglycan-associated lipoprotein
MRKLKFLLVASVLMLATGCACKSKNVGADNIGMAGDGGPLKDVYFAFDSYALDNTAKATLQENVKWMQENSSAKVQVEGHCDSRGTNEYNMVLGQKRATSVFDYYKTLGVDSSRLSTISYGEELPLDPRENEEAWAKNRRAHSAVQK